MKLHGGKKWLNWFTPKFPKHLDLELNASCSNSCKMCPMSLTEKERGFKFGKMDIDKAKQIIYYFSQNGCESIKLFWRGEPTININLVEILRYAKKHGLFTMLNTNGAFPFDNMHEIADHLDWISLSMDQFHDNENWETFQKILIFKNRGMYTEIQTSTPSELYETYCTDYGVVYKKDILIKRTPNNNYKCLDLSKYKRKYCGFPSWRMIITYDFKIKPCCVCWKDKELTMFQIDFKKHNLNVIKEVWNGEIYKQFRKELKRGKYYNQLCEHCTSKAAYKIK